MIKPRCEACLWIRDISMLIAGAAYLGGFVCLYDSSYRNGAILIVIGLLMHLFSRVLDEEALYV